MSYNGSGTFNINSTGQPVVAGTVITASAFNALTTDLATGLTTAITKDGQTTTTARITFAQGFTSSLVTDSSSVSTGSIITAGGAGIAKNLYVGVNANVAGTLGVTGVATFSAAPIYSSLTASSAVATDASKGLVSVTNTGTGNNVLATAPTIASLNLTTALTLTGASGTAGQALTSGGSGVAPTWTTISSTPTAITNGTSNVTVNSSGGTITAATNGTTAITIDTSQKVTFANPIQGGSITSGTAVDSTSGTSIDFTSIPSWVKRITVMFNAVSTVTTSNYLVQLGDSGGIENTGYTSLLAYTGAATGKVTSTSGFIFATAVGAQSWSGQFIITLVSGNIYVQSSCVSDGSDYTGISGGTKTLSGVLDRVRITTAGGTDTFDAGSINILYEG